MSLINNGSFTKPRNKNYHRQNQENNEIAVLASVEANHSNSCRNIETNVGVSKSQTQRILKKYKYKPYKVNIVQQLHPGDAQRRIVFCNWFLEQTRIDPNFARKVIWSDEAYISCTGIFNRHNNRHWYTQNPYLLRERQQQGRFGFSVSCFILGTKIKYVFYEHTLTAARYLEILQRILPELLDEIPLAFLNSIYFQQDGAPAHNSQIVRPFIIETFEDRWIGTHAPNRWPARSPDLSVLDFFVWSFLKNKIYLNVVHNLQELQDATVQAFEALQARPLIILNALRRITTLCQLCVQENGNHFEQFN